MQHLNKITIRAIFFDEKSVLSIAGNDHGLADVVDCRCVRTITAADWKYLVEIMHKADNNSPDQTVVGIFN